MPSGIGMLKSRWYRAGGVGSTPIDESVAAFAKRVGRPLDVTIRMVHWCDDAGLVKTSLGMGGAVTAETLVEGKYA